jgi:hypothetical protein
MKLVSLYVLLRLRGIRMIKMKQGAILVFWSEPDVWADEVESLLDSKSFTIDYTHHILPEEMKLWGIKRVALGIYYDVVFGVGEVLSKDQKYFLFKRRERLPELLQVLTKTVATVVILISVILYLAYFS